ncbi:proline- glutamic acid-and [Salix suchowensis]|nr:proline- glutamic acid-and [Salix suchowensis]
MIEGFKFRSMLLNWSVMKWARVFLSLIDDQENILFMRVLFCKIRCPFICFCKPSPRIYGPGPGPLKLENSPHVPSTAVISVAVADASYDDDHVLNDSVEVKEGNAGVYGEEPQAQNGLKSSLKKAGFDSKEVDKKKVRWIDSLGKELVEIREFESSETEDSDIEDQSNRGCACTIL